MSTKEDHAKVVGSLSPWLGFWYGVEFMAFSHRKIPGIHMQHGVCNFPISICSFDLKFVFG